jgi:hypothetical protein
MHSALLLQGSTVVYAMLAAMPEMNDKVSVVAHMGPVVSSSTLCPWPLL